MLAIDATNRMKIKNNRWRYYINNSFSKNYNMFFEKIKIKKCSDDTEDIYNI
jgi:hypothetical protein